jgi:hypothetical protein
VEQADKQATSLPLEPNPLKCLNHSEQSALNECEIT